MQNDRANRMQQKLARSAHAFSRKQENTVNKNKKEKTTYTYLRYIPSRSSYGAWINLIFTPIDFSRDSTSDRYIISKTLKNAQRGVNFRAIYQTRVKSWEIFGKS